VDFILTGGQTYDAKVAVELLKKVDISGSHILADKAYGAVSSVSISPSMAVNIRFRRSGTSKNRGNMTGNATSIVM